MKNLNTVLFTAALAATVSLAANASAQLKPAADDGIAASPKVRQMLDERAAAAQATLSAPVRVAYHTPETQDVTASPKVLQSLAERKGVVSTTPVVEMATTGYRPTGADGITASPKLRAQLDERGPAIIIAPLKSRAEAAAVSGRGHKGQEHPAPEAQPEVPGPRAGLTSTRQQLANCW